MGLTIMNELIFIIEESPEGGVSARVLLRIFFHRSGTSVPVICADRARLSKKCKSRRAKQGAAVRQGTGVAVVFAALWDCCLHYDVDQGSLPSRSRFAGGL